MTLPLRYLENPSQREIEYFIEKWGSKKMIVSTGDYSIQTLSCFIYEIDDVLLGMLSFSETKDTIEIVSLDSSWRNRGIGSSLLRTLENRAEELKKNVQVVTTNANHKAIKFYERHGYKCVFVFEGAVDEARKVKPTIPLIEYGIEVHDELLYMKNFSEV